jgi:hypothetical protein
MKTVHVPRAVFLHVVLLATALPLCGCTENVFSVRRAIDINSGDVRHQTFFWCLPVSTRVVESPFSREVRRLHIPTLEGRAWKLATISNWGRIESQEYDGAIEDCDFLVNQMKLLTRIFHRGDGF